MIFASFVAFWFGVHTLVGANMAMESVAEKIRAGQQPPIEVMFGMGFDDIAREAKLKRQKFFTTHELVNGKWEPKTVNN